MEKYIWERLFISQPAVSKHIGELESQYKVQLFMRRGSRLELTGAGETLLACAERLADDYRRMQYEMSLCADAPVGELRLGASTTIAQYLLPGILASFRRRYPEIDVELANGNTEQIEELVAGGRIDIGMIEGKATGHALHYEPFMHDELVLVTSASNSAFRDDEVDMATLGRLPLVIRENGSGTLDILTEALARCGLELQSMNIEMQLGSSESIKRYLYDSGAFAFISIQAILDELAHNKLRIVDTDGLEINRSFSFVTAHGNYGRLPKLFKQFCTNHHNTKL